MLVMQGIKSREFWLGQKIDENLAKELLIGLTKTKNNLVLSGMAGSGKSSVGKLVSEKLNMPFYDVDEVITEKYGKSPSEIITESGEEAFRDIETKVICELSRDGGKVISLGGGSVLRRENVTTLKRNGVIIYLERDVNKLSTENRPLSKKQGVKELFEKRKPIYNLTKDQSVSNNKEIEQTVKGVIEKYEDSCYKRS
jgi:shikimate dehydrogenase